MAFHEFWVGKQVILVILAHPDDPEFFCGGTIARWCAAGHDVHYLLFTRGDKGSNDPEMTPEKLMRIRESEQRAAADVLGVKTISYLDKQDGYVSSDLETRKSLVGCIRKIRPNIIVTSDPANLFTRDGHINHPDHRSVGEQVIDAIFPGVGNRLFFPELLDEGLEPHKVNELWLSIPNEANTVIDVTDNWEMKLKALTMHASQIGNEDAFKTRMKLRKNLICINERVVYEEKFKRIKLK